MLTFAGVAVFIAAVLLGLVSLTYATVLGPGSDRTVGLSWHNLRSLELYLMTASLGVVVAIMASSRHAFVVSLGIVLIGALIVPSRDMVRFALLFTDSLQKIDELYPERDVGTQLLGRDSDLASNIITALQMDTEIGAPLLEELPVKHRSRAKAIIENEIRKERTVTLAERVTQEGGQGVLIALAMNNFKDYAYQQGKEPEFLPTLAFLRSQSLVEFDFNNTTNARLSCLGFDVAALLKLGSLDFGASADPCSPAIAVDSGSGGQGVVLPSASQSSGGAPESLSEGFALPNRARTIDELVSQCEVDFEQNISNAAEFKIDEELNFVVSDRPTIKYVSVEGLANSQSVMNVSSVTELAMQDPFVVILALRDGRCNLHSFNDDHPQAPGLESRVALDWPDGVYGIAVGEFFSQPASFVAKVIAE